MQEGFGKLQVLVKKKSADLQKHMKEHSVKLFQHLSTRLAERVVGARQGPICKSSRVAGWYVQEWHIHLNHIKGLVQEPPRVVGVHVEKLGKVLKEMPKVIMPNQLGKRWS